MTRRQIYAAIVRRAAGYKKTVLNNYEATIFLQGMRTQLRANEDLLFVAKEYLLGIEDENYRIWQKEHHDGRSIYKIPCGLVIKRNAYRFASRKTIPLPARWMDGVGKLVSKKQDQIEAAIMGENGFIDSVKAEEYLVSDRRFFSDRMRYIALKRGGFKCAFCGAAADEERLEVDHVIPYDRGGPTSIANSRVVCGKCNRGVYHAEQKHTHKEYCNK